MKTTFITVGITSLFLFLFSSCSVTKKSGGDSTTKIQIPGPQVIIYSMKSDYSKRVPVILSPDKKTVISYPDIRDVILNGKPAYPTPLHKGFYLDNKGISVNVAFLKLTYEEYAALPKTPTEEEIRGMILVKKPIKKMYACGLKAKYTDLTEELNKAIDADDFSAFQRLK